MQELDRRRARSVGAEIGTILAYPLSDPVAFIVLAAFIGFFAFARRFAPPAILFSEGTLYAYSFYALGRVSDGDLKPVMPDFTGLEDFVWPLQIGAAAFVISWAPMTMVLTWLFVSPNPPSSLGIGLLALAVLWGLAYAPAAMTVAAITEHTLAILNPAVGISVIRRMGSVYWQAMGICTAIELAGLGVDYLLGPVPWLGVFASPFARVYSALAIGCTLGLAVFKRPPELI